MCTDDRAIVAGFQRAMATARATTVVELPTSHSPFFSRPEAVAELLIDLARHVGVTSHERRNREFWDADADAYQAVHEPDLTRAPRAWGVWRIPEADLHVLGDVVGRDVLEYGCGAAQWSVALARAGARAGRARPVACTAPARAAAAGGAGRRIPARLRDRRVGAAA